MQECLSVASGVRNNDDENNQNDETDEGQQQFLPPRLVLKQGFKSTSNQNTTHTAREVREIISKKI
jgi:hypothetical protein